MQEEAGDNLVLKCWEIADSCLAGNLRRVTRAVTKIYDDAVRPIGIRATQLNLLVAIFLVGPATITQLAEVMGMDRTTLTRNVGLLGRQGYIDITIGHDQRTRSVSITESGKRIIQRAIPLWENAQAEIVMLLGKTHIESILSELKYANKIVQ